MASERDDVLGAVSNWLDYRIASSAELGKEMDTLRLVSSAEMRGNTALRNHVREVVCRLQRLSSTLNELAVAAKEQIDAFGDVSRKCGIALLPDEVLATIFDFAVEHWKKWKMAVKLSHVDRQFRSVALESPRLWTQMSSRGEMVKTCFSRTKGLPLEVDLHVHCYHSPVECRFDPVLLELLPLAKNWGTLSIFFGFLHSRDEESRGQNLSGRTMRHASVDAPLLRKLTFYGEQYEVAPHDVFDWSLWNCPQLRYLDADKYFPLHLPGLSNVSTLYITLHTNDENMSEILSEITGMKNMDFLSLEFVHTHENWDIEVLERFEFPQVRRLKITTTLSYLKEDINTSLKRIIFSSLFFPGAVEFHLELNGGDLSDFEYDSYFEIRGIRDYDFNKEINRIFRHVDQFPLVEFFSLDISSPIGDRRSRVSIPFNMLPSLKRFVFDSNTSFTIEEPEDPDEIYYEEENMVAPRVVGDVLPVLESMTFRLRAGKPAVIAGWVGQYLRGLKEGGRWNELLELVVMGYGASDLGKMSYVGEKALEWCDDQLREEQGEEESATTDDADSDDESGEEDDETDETGEDEDEDEDEEDEEEP
ncbi:hypothetical protein SCHPADRAFT_932008 [Schizopora paradoxa]|uniref:Uncharacterized protein n=1 Tax=Schizopora paradoxa TaxID=27342 RepID=A0A0H2R8A3_9AGAM|nr:hypothetical protein SCHPADRAFT_932008 [Schizopora paradoxa]